MKPLSEVVHTAFTPATPENIDQVFTARFGLLGIIMLVLGMTAAIVLLIGPLH
jgi:hypothetical protein